ncbi:MAG: response regulator transcription factor [Pseudobdellovibrio sp.]
MNLSTNQTKTLFVGHALIVEDDAAIAKLLKIHICELGLSVDIAIDAETAFALMQTTNYAVCLLDWMLPGIQGIDLLKKVRTQNSQLKILMLTAKVDSESIVRALDAGADDYLTKPFDSKVLLARVRNLLRRSDYQKQFAATKTPEDEMTLDGLTIHFSKYFVRNANEDIHLTPSEFKLLAALFKAQGLVLTRDQLISQIQGDDISVTGRTIDTHIFALRKKLGIWSSHIETIRGVGYRVLISNLDFTQSPDDESL